jgi:hypothetical protein
MTEFYNQSIYFDGNDFNDFPVSIFKNYSIFINSCEKDQENKKELFSQEKNKKFINETIIKGICTIYVVNLNKIDINQFKLIVRNFTDEKELSYNKVPTIYYNSDTSRFIYTYLCVKCGPTKKYIDDLRESIIMFRCCLKEEPSKELEVVLEEAQGAQGAKEAKEAQGTNDSKKKLYVYVNIGSTKAEKFQDSMKREAIRLEFASRREKYKKQMRQISTKKSRTSTSSLNSDKKITDKKIGIGGPSEKICKAKTKKGERCTNKTLVNSDYCGIASHKNIKEQIIDSIKQLNNNHGIVTGSL